MLGMEVNVVDVDLVSGVESSALSTELLESQPLQNTKYLHGPFKTT